MRKHYHGYICSQWRRTSLWTKQCAQCHKQGTTWMGYAAFVWLFGVLILGFIVVN
jgi:hypothetical protein